MKMKNYTCFTAQEYIGDKEEISVSERIIDSNYDVHWHDFFEIEIILEGGGTHILNGCEYTIERGLLYLLSPTDFHEVKPNGTIRLCNIMFHESMLSEEFLYAVSEEQCNNIFKLSENELNEIIDMCKIFEAEYKKNEKYKNEFLKNMLECFLILILRKLKILKQKQEKNESQYIQKAILHMHLHFKENPSLFETARVVSLNPNYFSQRFKETTGKTYKEYLTGLKLSYAKKLLLSSNLSVTEICFASGFSSLSNFMKVFREKTDCSPAKYKKV